MAMNKLDDDKKPKADDPSHSDGRLVGRYRIKIAHVLALKGAPQRHIYGFRSGPPCESLP